jgi:hypothetical protein
MDLLTGSLHLQGCLVLFVFVTEPLRIPLPAFPLLLADDRAYGITLPTGRNKSC